MDIEIHSTKESLNWIEIWHITLLHPTLETFARIITDPKVSIKWGIVWMMSSSIIAWLGSPLRPIVHAILFENFGFRKSPDFLLSEAIIMTVFGLLLFLLGAGISHGVAHFFGGAGTYRKLVYCWGVMLPPFAIISGLVTQFPLLFSSSLSFQSSTFGLAIQMFSLLVYLGIYLYKIYASVVAFSSVENFGIRKGFSVLALQAIILGILVGCLSSSLQSVILNSLRSY